MRYHSIHTVNIGKEVRHVYVLFIKVLHAQKSK